MNSLDPNNFVFIFLQIQAQQKENKKNAAIIALLKSVIDGHMLRYIYSYAFSGIKGARRCIIDVFLFDERR